jgi:hypothetical protein
LIVIQSSLLNPKIDNQLAPFIPGFLALGNAGMNGQKSYGMQVEILKLLPRIVKVKLEPAHPQFSPLTLAWGKRGEGPSRTPNKELRSFG